LAHMRAPLGQEGLRGPGPAAHHVGRTPVRANSSCIAGTFSGRPFEITCVRRARGAACNAGGARRDGGWNPPAPPRSPHPSRGADAQRRCRTVACARRCGPLRSRAAKSDGCAIFGRERGGGEAARSICAFGPLPRTHREVEPRDRQLLDAALGANLVRRLPDGGSPGKVHVARWMWQPQRVERRMPLVAR
jgi:hypothetical protein